MNYKRVISELEKRKVKIAEERDKLRDVIDEYEDLHNVCSEAVDNIDAAIDALSQLV